MLSNLGDTWDVVQRSSGGDEGDKGKEDNVAPLTDSDSSQRRAEAFRNHVQERCLMFHRKQGTI
ncbi:hypothetical protein PGT21_016868 [Puccinia graminis f. sp. tritici]|uniref:Uncharacterized protein n=1 Tax=Puccinia graminis f. sp. tritici TaxID=56615 RepID=A0A5B0LPX9_PUCGR|nr:hypothetical protein PGT21_016868 [Puccinia graminis f. sp. tritici]KAA1130505.1 hypothetical protein PGTUg99_011178 [Puccinia graminis f. sp. tritici]